MLITSRIFILEALFSITYAGLSYFIIPGFSRNVAILDDEERDLLIQRLEKEREKERGSGKASMTEINWLGVLSNWIV